MSADSTTDSGPQRLHAMLRQPRHERQQIWSLKESISDLRSERQERIQAEDSLPQTRTLSLGVNVVVNAKQGEFQTTEHP